MLTEIAGPTNSYARAPSLEIAVALLASVDLLLLIVCIFQLSSAPTFTNRSILQLGTAGCQVSFGNCTSTDISPDGTCKSTKQLL